MNFDLTQAFLLCVSYLLVLFGIAYGRERGWIPALVERHPIAYILSLGVFASAWSYYGLVDLAFQYGYGALAYYLGTGAFFLFAPLVLGPLMRLSRIYQLGSLADLLVFRYRSQAVGAIATGCMVLGVLPLFALQIQAVADTLHILTLPADQAFSNPNRAPWFKELTALVYFSVLALFTILFGSNRERHRGLIAAMAFESLIKLTALIAVGALAVWGVFGGLGGLDAWLLDHPEHRELLHNPIREASAHTLLLVFLATAVAMPHVFHVSIVENPREDTYNTLTWGFPLFLLVMALPIFPILWAGFELGVPLPPQYFTLGVPIAFGSPTIAVLTFLGGLSAATGAVIIISLALATLVQNHWVLPLYTPGKEKDLYGWLIWLRRFLLGAIIMAGYLTYLAFHNTYSITNLALLAFIETLQFLPGILSVFYWKRGNRTGFIGGIIAGTAVWVFGLLLPMAFDFHQFPLGHWQIPVGIEVWHLVTLASLGANLAVFTLLSLTTPMTPEERNRADLCSMDDLSSPLKLELDVSNAAEFKERLAQSLGPVTAAREVERALRDLQLPSAEKRAYALRRLRERLQANLSGLVGAAVAHELIDRHFPYQLADTGSTAADIQLIENRLLQYRSHLTGMAAELDTLRRYHRHTLEQLPLGIASLGHNGEVLFWNRAMATMTGIDADEATGSALEKLPPPWAEVFGDFVLGSDSYRGKQAVAVAGGNRWVNLHKASLDGGDSQQLGGQVILMEDVSETQLLEEELLHSERLASVGRLAAGVAHEIGNPVTGIDCLAQNLRYDAKDSDTRQLAEQILEQTRRITRIVQSLVNFAHAGRGQGSEVPHQPVAVKAVVQEAIDLLALQKDKTPVQFNNAVPADLLIVGDDQRLAQVFINLLSNARDASPEQGEIRVEGEAAEQSALIRVIDQGTGISAKQREQIFDPFFTTKAPGKGTGLGLSMVYSIIEQHFGDIDIQSPVADGRGTCFQLRLPRYFDSHAEDGTTKGSLVPE